MHHFTRGLVPYSTGNLIYRCGCRLKSVGVVNVDVKHSKEDDNLKSSVSVSHGSKESSQAYPEDSGKLLAHSDSSVKSQFKSMTNEGTTPINAVNSRGGKISNTFNKIYSAFAPGKSTQGGVFQKLPSNEADLDSADKKYLKAISKSLEMDEEDTKILVEVLRMYEENGELGINVERLTSETKLESGKKVIIRGAQNGVSASKTQDDVALGNMLREFSNMNRNTGVFSYINKLTKSQKMNVFKKGFSTCADNVAKPSAPQIKSLMETENHTPVPTSATHSSVAAEKSSESAKLNATNTPQPSSNEETAETTMSPQGSDFKNENKVLFKTPAEEVSCLLSNNTLMNAKALIESSSKPDTVRMKARGCYSFHEDNQTKRLLQKYKELKKREIVFHHSQIRKHRKELLELTFRQPYQKQECDCAKS